MECSYCDIQPLFANSHVHLNVRSLIHKVNKLERLLASLNLPKVVLLSETWLNETNALADIANSSFIWSPRIFGRGEGVGAYISSNLRYHVIVKSSLDSVPLKTNIDFLLLELTSVNIALCCLYCPSKTKPN